MRPRKLSSIWPCVFLLLFGCYEPREGCLDALASNFAIDADEHCCCEYPQLTFTLKHLYDSLDFDLGSIYENRLGQHFIPQRINFYFSDVSLAQGSDWIGVDETIELSVNSVINTEPDDVTEINRRGFEFPVGEFLTPGVFTAVRFSVGLNPPEVDAFASEFEDTHPLDTANNELWSQMLGYLSYSCEIISDTAQLDTLTLVDAASPSIPIELPVELLKTRGAKLTIPLAIDYRQWFESIDFENDDEELIRQKISAGIKNSTTFRLPT